MTPCTFINKLHDGIYVHDYGSSSDKMKMCASWKHLIFTHVGTTTKVSSQHALGMGSKGQRSRSHGYRVKTAYVQSSPWQARRGSASPHDCTVFQFIQLRSTTKLRHVKATRTASRNLGLQSTDHQPINQHKILLAEGPIVRRVRLGLGTIQPLDYRQRTEICRAPLYDTSRSELTVVSGKHDQKVHSRVVF